MFENNSQEKIQKEVTELVENIEYIKENVDIYCELMKKMILNTSNLN